MYFLMNLGAGRVRVPSTLDQAHTNMSILLVSAGLPTAYRRDIDATEDDGRFAFLVPVRGRDVSVLMPGIPLDVLMDPIRIDTPRLYVNGSSWYWKYAVGVLRDYANGVERS